MVVFQKPFSVFRQIFRESRKSVANIGKIVLANFEANLAQTLERICLSQIHIYFHDFKN